MFVEDKAIIGLMIGRNHPKTKVVCTIGLASESPGILESLIMSGMNIVRLNFFGAYFRSFRRSQRISGDGSSLKFHG